jgi:putative addiction module component (TIGR02574 family)
MADPVADLVHRARSLDAGDRLRLVELVLDSLEDEPLATVEAVWAEEITRRVEAFGRGEVKTFPADEVFAEARRIAP